MQNSKTMAPAIIQTNENLETFKKGVDTLLAQRKYFIQQVMPILQENIDYFIIKGRKSLGKSGAEKMANIFGYQTTFARDHQSVEMLGNIKGLVAYVCTLTHYGKIVGEGRGSDTLERNNNDANKTLKLAEKRAYVNAVIRSTGLSDIFSQDIEDMESEQVVEYPKEGKDNECQNWMNNPEDKSNKPIGNEEYPKSDSMITEKQKTLLVSLINRKVHDEEQRETLLNDIDSLDKSEASQYIKEFIEQ
ncbi:MAG: hypothetical protein WC178_05145 [Candidatus Paceibacterota bacterium]